MITKGYFTGNRIVEDAERINVLYIGRIQLRTYETAKDGRLEEETRSNDSKL
jgi:hypothetical protein